ncbi:hypothetical protein, partial [Brachybacterium paraconglomeratum]|uniref:hypothetical protein n=1 Tax=Brachybacterium paraconglomeratum TaxID=173362 RepID=UPI0021A6D116
MSVHGRGLGGVLHHSAPDPGGGLHHSGLDLGRFPGQRLQRLAAALAGRRGPRPRRRSGPTWPTL